MALSKAIEFEESNAVELFPLEISEGELFYISGDASAFTVTS